MTGTTSPGSAARTRPGLPTVDQVLAIPAAAHQTAPAEWEDVNGHVNVAAYYSFHMGATGGSLAEVGWDDDYVRETGLSIFSVEHHLAFYDEVLVGHEVSVHLRLLGRNERFLHAVSILLDRTTGRVANTVQVVEAHVDLATRRTTAFRPEMAATLDRVIARHQAMPWSVPLNGDMGLR